MVAVRRLPAEEFQAERDRVHSVALCRSVAEREQMEYPGIRLCITEPMQDASGNQTPSQDRTCRMDRCPRRRD
ncbi:hypothetical protein GCM10027416_28850 [Okibacterium endophyticum]